MSETKHNIGPVNVIPAGEGYHSLLSPEREDEPHYTAIIQANDDELSARVAALFAAAPDMLEALALLIEEFDDPSRVIDEGRKCDFGIVEVIKGAGIALSTPAIRKARAALAKAEGRS